MAEIAHQLRAALADRYLIEHELGRGGMATVYLANDLKHGRPVAIKVLRRELAATLGPERFLREIQIAARLNHPNILPLHDSGEAAGLLYYAMPYVQGESLRARLQRERQLPVADALRIATQVAAALDYAHSHGVVHRDIKPENILVTGEHCTVADFGIARALDVAGGEKLTETGLALGTPSYMSPEQASGDRVLDGRSDLYSLACVVYEMLVGEPPFTGPSQQAILARHVLDPVPPLRSVRPAIPEHTERAVRRALGKVPADRFASSEDFAHALLTPGPLQAFQATEKQRRLRLPKRRRLALALGLAAATLLAVGAAGLLSSRVNRSALTAHLVAVAPFDVVDPRLQLWREGLADYLARNLDGAGDLRTVAPSVVLQSWKGRAGPGSAEELGRRTGAGVVVFGNLSPVGRDSVRVRATIFNAALNSGVADFEGSDQLDRMDRLADSLTIEVLRALVDTASGTPVRVTAVGTRSIPALKAYLKGEQYYRRAVNDSAEMHFNRAIALDTTFALALHALATLRGWSLQNLGLYWRAAQFNRGLTPRDSLLIVVDSLRAAADGFDTAYWSHRVRMLEMAAGPLAGDNPDYTKAAQTFAELLYHFGEVLGSTWFGKDGQSPHRVRQAFDRAIELDPEFAHIYFHPIELAGDPIRARPYIQGYLDAVGPEGGSGEIRLLATLIDPVRGRGQSLDSVDTGDLDNALGLTRTWQDSAELALRLAPVFAARPDIRAGPDIAELRGAFRREFQRHYPAELLAYRGHIKEARRLTGSDVTETFLDLALMGAIPSDSASIVVAAWFREPRNRKLHPSWWASRRDTTALMARLASEEKTARMTHVRWPEGNGPPDVALLQSAPALTRAYLALARADTADALRRVLALPDSVFAGDWRERLLKFQLLAGAGKDGEASTIFDAAVLPATSPLWVLGALERGRVAERRRQRDPEPAIRGIERVRAIQAYRFVADVWRHADPELQPYVREARKALERLGPE